MKRSKDEKKIDNAIKSINSLETIADVESYIAGDDRQDVLNAALVQIDFIQKSTPEIEPPALPETPEPEQPAVLPDPLPENTPKDTTDEWIRDLRHLQPKQDEAGNIIQDVPATSPKGEALVPKEGATKIMTMRDGKPMWIHFDEEGSEIKVEPIR